MNRRERKKEETRARIVQVAVALFQRHGFDGVTMERIAAEADIAKGTLYSYFPAKEAVLAGWMRGLTAEVGERIDSLLKAAPATRERIRALLDPLRELVEGHRELVERYVHYRISSPERFLGDPTLRSGIDGALRGIIAQGQAEGDVRFDRSPEELTSHFETLLLSTLMIWFADPAGEGLAARLDGLVTLFFDGVATRHDR